MMKEEGHWTSAGWIPKPEGLTPEKAKRIQDLMDSCVSLSTKEVNELVRASIALASDQCDNDEEYPGLVAAAILESMLQTAMITVGAIKMLTVMIADMDTVEDEKRKAVFDALGAEVLDTVLPLGHEYGDRLIKAASATGDPPTFAGLVTTLLTVTGNGVPPHKRK